MKAPSFLNSIVLMRTIFLLVLFSNPEMAYALPENICGWRADLVASTALERDKGAKKEKVAKKIIKELGSAASGFKAYVDVVYSRPEISPIVFRKIAYESCLRE